MEVKVNPIVEFYLFVSLITFAIDEKYNLDNPRYPNASTREYLFCNWKEEDFYPIDIIGGPLLRVECEEDSKIKHKARRKYWERNVETERQE